MGTQRGKTRANFAVKAAAFFFVALLMVSGCGGGGTTGSTEDIYLEGQTRVAVAFYSGTAAGDPYIENCVLGFERLRGQNIDPHFFENPGGRPFGQILAEAVASGPDIVWCLDRRGAEDMAAAAADNPEIQFITLEHAYTDPLPNLAGVYFDTPGASFLAGYLAVAATEGGEVGYLGGTEGAAPEEFGFKAGVVYAGNLLNKSIRVHTAFAGDDFDGAAAERAAATLYGEGCDIVFQSAGHAVAGAVTAAQNAGKLLIGVNYGQYSVASPPEQVAAFISESVDARADGITKLAAGGQIGGQNHFFGFPTNSVRIEQTGTFFTEGQWQEMLDVQSRMLRGEFEPPMSQEELNDFIEAEIWIGARPHEVIQGALLSAAAGSVGRN
jgi:basic membrane protein A